MSLEIITDNAPRPVTIEEVKHWTGVPDDSDDVRIMALIDAANDHVEDFARITVKQKTFDYRIRGFDNCMKLPHPPLISVDSVKYIDVDGVEQTLSSSVYDVDINKTPGEIRLAYNQTWPTVRDVENNVIVRFTAGYTTIPEKIKLAILLLVDHWYEHRSAITELKLDNNPLGFESLLHTFKQFKF
jgi:uncharacterized phiE125 gp8 family phage protein